MNRPLLISAALGFVVFIAPFSRFASAGATAKPTVTPQPIELSQEDRDQLIPRILKAQAMENEAMIQADAWQSYRKAKQTELARKYGLREVDIWQFDADGRLHYKGMVGISPASVSGTAR